MTNVQVYAAGEPAQNPVPRGKRRWGIVIVGIVIATIGLLAVIGGGLATAIEQTRSAVDPEAEGRTPGSLVFTAKADLYRVSIQGERFGADASSVANTRCTVELADGGTVELDGGVQAIGETTGNIAKVGSFTGVAGPTTITCAHPDDGVRFFVDDESAVQSAGALALVGGFIVGTIGAGLILFGIFVRKQPTVRPPTA